MKDLAEGRRDPASREEKSFIMFTQGQRNAASPMETAWAKYLNRHKLEASLLVTDELYQEYIQRRVR